MTTASREDYSGEIGRGSDPRSRSRRVPHREMSYPRQNCSVAFGKFRAARIGVLDAGKRRKTKGDIRARESHRPQSKRLKPQWFDAITSGLPPTARRSAPDLSRPSSATSL